MSKIIACPNCSVDDLFGELLVRCEWAIQPIKARRKRRERMQIVKDIFEILAESNQLPKDLYPSIPEEGIVVTCGVCKAEVKIKRGW